MNEPKIISAAFKEPLDDDYLYIECKFDNGVHGIIVSVDADFPMLAESILLHLQGLTKVVR